MAMASCHTHKHTTKHTNGIAIAVAKTQNKGVR